MQFAASLHDGFYQPSLSMQPIFPNHYFPAGGGPTCSDSFSRGSSTYPHPDYRYYSDRGGPSTRLPEVSTSTVSTNNLDATGPGFAGNPLSDYNDLYQPEEIADYDQQWQQWPGISLHGLPTPLLPHPLVAQVPVSNSSFAVIKSTISQNTAVRTPAAQLPTPAAMAVLLNPNARSEVVRPSPQGSDVQPQSAVMGTLPAPISTANANQIPPATRAARVTELGAGGAPSAPDSQSREKKHGCTMCHKRFDRPSTLRKHLLVHTGEKAFVCDTCGRRFGVASNLNRHVRKCILKPVNTSPSRNRFSSDSPASNSPDLHNMSTAITASPTQEKQPTHVNSVQSKKRGRAPSTTISSNGSNTSIAAGELSASQPQSQGDRVKAPVQKRRRRPPSPSQWIPCSLLNFNLVSEDFFKSAPLPLPPVRRNPPKEERDSWDENVGSAPYHPCGWKGVLPGPGIGSIIGLGGKDVRNINLGGSGGFTLGRVLVF